MSSWRKILKALQPGQLEPLEIRNAILDEIEELVQPLGDGRRGLVQDRIVIRLLSADAARRRFIESALMSGDGLQAAVLRRLEAHGLSAPAGLRIDLSNEEAPALTSTERDFELTATVEGKPAATLAAHASELAAKLQPRPRARVVVLGPDGPVRAVEIDRDTFHIGRLQEVRDRSHRPARRNHLFFSEAETSISRQHAHIRYNPETGEFRIFDDASARGTRLFSNGQPIDVPSGRGRGEQLHDGDEIYFGSVAVRFEIGARE